MLINKSLSCGKVVEMKGYEKFGLLWKMWVMCLVVFKVYIWFLFNFFDLKVEYVRRLVNYLKFDFLVLGWRVEVVFF